MIRASKNINNEERGSGNGTLARVMDYVKKGEGFTLCPTGGELTFGVDDMVVSLGNHGRQFDSYPSEEDVQAYLAAKKHVLSMPGRLLGGWASEDGHYWLDISVTVKGLLRGILYGVDQGQQAVWWPAKDAVIDISEAAPLRRKGVGRVPQCRLCCSQGIQSHHSIEKDSSIGSLALGK